GRRTNSVGGPRARLWRQGSTSEHVKQLLAQLEHTLPGLSKMATGVHLLSYWPAHTWTRGSRSYYAQGDRLLFGGYEAVRQGNVQFCGEHTSLTAQGALIGAVETSRRCSDSLVKDRYAGGGPIRVTQSEPDVE